jgi:hypothetical protein
MVRPTQISHKKPFQPTTVLLLIFKCLSKNASVVYINAQEKMNLEAVTKGNFEFSNHIL